MQKNPAIKQNKLLQRLQKKENEEENVQEKEELEIEIEQKYQDIPDTQNKEKDKKKKKTTKRINLNDKNLLYSNEGIKKIYDVMINQDFNSSKDVNKITLFTYI
jgi:hemolysin activation/secretion protein